MLKDFIDKGRISLFSAILLLCLAILVIWLLILSNSGKENKHDTLVKNDLRLSLSVMEKFVSSNPQATRDDFFDTAAKNIETSNDVNYTANKLPDGRWCIYVYSEKAAVYTPENALMYDMREKTEGEKLATCSLLNK